jgi:hypothetical protein
MIAQRADEKTPLGSPLDQQLLILKLIMANNKINVNTFNELDNNIKVKYKLYYNFSSQG